MIPAHSAFQVAGILYTLAFVASFLPGRRQPFVLLALVTAILANSMVIVLRYHQAWPMLPMHLGPVALPLCLALLYPCATTKRDAEHSRIALRRSLLGINVVFILLALLFPKDFYLPFLKSKNLFAHAFLFFGILGKGCFTVSALWAMVALTSRSANSDRKEMPAAMNRSLLFAAWGFILWTLSMFSGEIWSYLGWGTPVVWEDPAITTTMAAWFFYACCLHLHFSRSWSPAGRARLASYGGIAVLLLTCLADFGPFRSPF